LPIGDETLLPKMCSSRPVVSLGVNRMSFGRFSAAEQVKARNTCIKYRFWPGRSSGSDL
jgi:hypothetical protein